MTCQDCGMPCEGRYCRVHQREHDRDGWDPFDDEDDDQDDGEGAAPVAMTDGGDELDGKQGGETA